MDQHHVQFSVGEGRCKIDFNAIVTPSGVSVTVTGGEKPHVGGTVLSVPRESLAGGRTSCDTWVTPVPGHKDVEAAKLMAELIARQTDLTVAVVAGIHSSNIRQSEINQIIDNCQQAAKMLVINIKEYLGDRDA